ncbi:hypothetical protein M2352_004007 [Azospirillum fermentarium]|uniref:aminoglycoside phosphotransferase family protein n=1 Tax=Azospirillum fermentarium TaxID=1233114 RepID=UPI002225F01E|nr:aminoglycoside phosphotransferase family protein [Azospirillum fermentarium]MCW2248373.1 hypothetical protein [Azospirillum fermentarium]
MALKGVAHDHVRLGDRGLVARLPRWSQQGLDPAANLAYQAEAFRRAAPCGHTPHLVAVLPPDPDSLPMGGLVVTEIHGRPPRLPDDMGAIARALAALHALPLPPAALRPPLLDPADPAAALLEQVERQAAAFDAAGLDPAARRLLDEELDAARRRRPDAPVPVALCGADTHPGNFLIDDAGRAWFTDLEKAHYSLPAIDLAHASLPTSTRWAPEVDAELSGAAVESFLADWAAAVPADLARAVAPWRVPMRRLTWLRTMTWMARWRVDGARLSAGMPEKLRTHLDARVVDIFRPAVIERVRGEWHLNG